MREEEIKTNPIQRIVIGVIAVLLLISTVAIYALTVLGAESKEQATEETNAKIAEVETKLTAKRNGVDDLAATFSDKYFNALNDARKARVKSYNAATVNNSGITTFDIKEGDGQVITSESKYYSYYVGWCADESIFDSSLDDVDNPTKLKTPLFYAGDGSLIAGWVEGVVGMKTGGIREIAMPGNLAYGDTRDDLCGGANAPLKFLVYIIDPGEEYQKLQAEYDEIYNEYLSLYYKNALLQQ